MGAGPAESPVFRCNTRLSACLRPENDKKHAESGQNAPKQAGAPGRLRSATSTDSVASARPAPGGATKSAEGQKAKQAGAGRPTVPLARTVVLCHDSHTAPQDHAGTPNLTPLPAGNVSAGAGPPHHPTGRGPT